MTILPRETLDVIMTHLRAGTSLKTLCAERHLNKDWLRAQLQARYPDYAQVVHAHRGHRVPRGPAQPGVIKVKPRAAVFHDQRLEDARQKDRAKLLERMPADKRGRGMEAFSAEELAALQAKIQRYVREGTCRVGPELPMTAWTQW